MSETSDSFEVTHLRKKTFFNLYFSALSALHHKRSLILGSCDAVKAHFFGESRDLHQYLRPNLRNVLLVEETQPEAGSAK
jgi:hypothetical protein